ncbi:MAG: TolC family protein [SAR86 cluster bacterium]|uniref:TolC family protein n=1 Tax=SAR86 cluster bacterium TaxID=2030880 RepID=A0A972VWS0_9GAMM|nr:TolC family protein [SAR86 cluster bacterium]|tara:strand:- start:1580 stop:2899 length:1320 start_codon:yes stop_codon:yes gene_type:complete
MNNKYYTIVSLLLLSGGVFASTVPETQNLRSLVDYALANNPEVNVARERHIGALARVPQAMALPEPKLTYRYFVNEVETRVGPQEHGIGLSQTLPWFGKRGLQGDAATEAARAAQERIASIQNTVIAEVANAYYELFYLGQSIEIIRGNRDLVLHLERVARARYGAGAATHADVIRAQVELGTIENRLGSLKDRRAPLFARLNALLNRPTTETFDLPSILTFEPVNYTDDELLAKVSLRNPDLRATSFEIEAAHRQRERANKNYLPDITLGLDYIATGDARMPGVQDSGDDALSATIGFTLPIWRSKYDAGVKEADAMLRQQQFKRDQQLNTFHAETVTALFKLRDAQRQIDLYEKTLLPKANESLVATQRAYSTGAAPFADTIDAQRMLLSFELSFARAITDHNQARIVLEKLTGQSLTNQSATNRPVQREESAHESH